MTVELRDLCGGRNSTPTPTLTAVALTLWSLRTSGSRMSARLQLPVYANCQLLIDQRRAARRATMRVAVSMT